MYDMYPDSWGPATHRAYRDETWTRAGRSGSGSSDQPTSDARDAAGQRPDDN